MNGKKKQRFSKEFKTKVVIEAMREDSTLQEIGTKHGVHPNQVSQWKKLAVEGLPELFERTNKKDETEREREAERDELLKIIGTQKMEVEYLKKKYKQLYGAEPPLLNNTMS
jgi:transposase-like protein